MSEEKIKTEKKNDNSLFNTYFGIIYSHPIAAAAFLCLLCISISTGQVTLANASLPAMGIAALGCAAAYYINKSAKDDEKKQCRQKAVLSAAAGFVTAFCFVYMVYTQGTYSIAVMNIGLAAVGAVFLFLAAADKLTVRNIILLLFAAGFIMRLTYVLSIPYDRFQHDVYSFGRGSGHSGYIEYIFANGHLPDFDVTTVDQFYHPPLHHIIAAVWLRLQTVCGISYENAFENIQILTLFYSTLCLILSYKIFRRMGLKDSGLITATAVITFCPAFYIMAGSVNNDILSIAFILGAVLNTLYWFKNRSMGRIICIALCIGLGMMTKLSVWMVAPAVAFIFIYVFFKELKSVKTYIVQYLVFLAVCAPLGLCWSVRNYLSWGVPFTFVQKLSENSSQYIGDTPLMTRLFSLDSIQFDDVAEQFTMFGGEYNEYNPLVGFFKTSVFDEGIAIRHYPLIEGFNKILFWSAVILGIAGFAAMIYMFFKKKNQVSVPVRIFTAIFYSVMLGCYYLFCFEFPHVCTQNIRYGLPLIVIGALSLGFLLQNTIKSKKPFPKYLSIALIALISVYSLSGIFVYNIVAA